MKQNILIVDDDPELRIALLHILAKKGYEPQGCATGEEAFTAAEDHPPDIAMIDLLLDDMPGLAVMKKILKESPATECIVMTGHGSQKSAAASMKLGAFAYLEKPFDQDVLLATVASAVRKQVLSKALSESEHRSRMLANNSLDAVYIVDRNLCLEFINEAGAAQLKKNIHDILGKPLLDILPEEHHTSLSPIHQVLETGESVNLTETYHLSSGPICMESLLAPIRDAVGNISAVHGISKWTTAERNTTT